MAFEYASDHKIDLSNVLGSGERGKINIFDIKITQQPKTFKFSRKHFPHEHHQGAIRVFSRSAPHSHHLTTSRQSLQPSENLPKQSEVHKPQVKTQVSTKFSTDHSQTFLTDLDYSNPKAVMPHFSIKRTFSINPLLKHIDELNQFSTTTRIELHTILAKIVNLTLQKFPEFRTLMIGKSFTQAKYLLIHYKSLVDESKYAVYEAWPNKSIQKSSLPKEELSKYPSIVILDGSETDLSSIEPVLGFNNVI